MGRNLNDLLIEIAASGLRLADITHIRAGGNSGKVLAPRSPEDLKILLPGLAEHGLTRVFVGGGSNTLIRDETDTYIIIDRQMPTTLTVAGTEVVASSAWNITSLTMTLAKQGLGGLEFLAGIPAHLGGVVKTNAGALRHEVSDLVTAVEVMDDNGEIRWLDRNEIRMGYRSTDIEGYIIAVRMRLNEQPEASVLKTIRDNIGRRRLTQPLDYPNLGCFFKNPPGHPAGWLIERCGLKGVRVGGAMVSPKHANFLINTGQATPADIVALAELVRETVRQKENVHLELEVQIV